MYRSLLELQSEDFSRAGFKRMIAHIFKNAKTVSPLVLRAIFGVVLKYKTPQILTDVFYLGYMKGQPWNTDTVSQFIEVLSKFKIFHEEVLSILTHYSKVSEAPIEISMISKYFDKLVENSLHQELLYFFDRVSSLTEFKQYKLDTTKTAAQNNEGLKVFEEKKLQGLKDFLSSFVDYLVQKNLLEHGELLFKNLLNKKWLGKHSDYLNGLIIYKDNLEMFDKIYQDYKARAELEKGPKEIQGILNLIVQAPLLYPNIYYDILDNYIYSVGFWVTVVKSEAG